MRYKEITKRKNVKKSFFFIKKYTCENSMFTML